MIQARIQCPTANQASERDTRHRQARLLGPQGGVQLHAVEHPQLCFMFMRIGTAAFFLVLVAMYIDMQCGLISCSSLFERVPAHTIPILQVRCPIT